MEQLVTSITNAATAAMSLVAGALSLWLTLMAILGAALAFAHRKV
jgi:hypothetical protein